MVNVKKKKHAEELFMLGFDQRKIAGYIDTSEQTLSKWSNDGQWAEKRIESKKLKKNISERIERLIDRQLEVMEAVVSGQRETDTYTPLDKGQVDALSKLFSGIKQKEIGFAQQVVLLTDFLDFAQKQNLVLAKQIAPLIELFIAQKRQNQND